LANTNRIIFAGYVIIHFWSAGKVKYPLIQIVKARLKKKKKQHKRMRGIHSVNGH
jgi:hypothetical protein